MCHCYIPLKRIEHSINVEKVLSYILALMNLVDKRFINGARKHCAYHKRLVKLNMHFSCVFIVIPSKDVCEYEECLRGFSSFKDKRTFNASAHVKFIEF